MITCKNCGSQQADGNVFCDICGNRLEPQPQQVPPQPQQIPPQAQQVPPQVQQVPPQVQQVPPQPQQIPPQPQQIPPQPQQIPPQAQQIPPQPQFSSKPAYAAAGGAAVKSAGNKKLPLIIAVCAAAIVVVLIVLAFVFLFKGGSNQSYLYFKDNALCVATGNNAGNEVSDRLTDSISDSSYNYKYKLSNDGSKIFYIDNDALYWNVTNDKKSAPTRIAYNVLNCAVDEKGNNVLFLTSAYDLYKYDLGKDSKEKVSSNVSSGYDYDDSFNKIVFLSNDNVLYLINGNADKEKIDSDVHLWYANSNYTTFYYSKDGSFYKKNAGSDDKTKLVSDIYSICSVYPESGKFYYTKKNEIVVNYSDMVADDLAASDAQIKEPKEPEYPTRADYPDYPFFSDYDDDKKYDNAVKEYEKKVKEIDDAYDKAYKEYEKAYDQYWEDRDAYRAKQSRDELREEIKNNSTTITTYSLYYYNGSEEKLIDDNYDDNIWYRVGSDEGETPVFAYRRSAYTGESGAKLKLSEISSIYDIESKISDSSYGSTADVGKFFVTEDKISELPSDIKGSIAVTNGGKTLYYALDEKAESSSNYSLYKSDISGGSISDGVKISDNISSLLMITDDGKAIYVNKPEGSTGNSVGYDLYIDDKLVDSDVYANYPVYYYDNALYYATDYSSTSQKATLKCYRSGESTKIKDDVSTYSVLTDGSVIFIYDYSITSMRGELYRYSGGTPEKVDDDVQSIIHINNDKIQIGVAY